MSEAQKKLPHNTKAHNRVFPYSLEVNGILKACYHNLPTALAVANGIKEGHWIVRNLQGDKLAESP